MEMHNINDLKRLIRGRWSVQNWRLRFHPPRGEFGSVDYRIRNTFCGTMKYKVFLKNETPVLQLKQDGCPDRKYAIGNFDKKEKLLYLHDLDTKEPLNFRKC